MSCAPSHGADNLSLTTTDAGARKRARRSERGWPTVTKMIPMTAPTRTRALAPVCAETLVLQAAGTAQGWSPLGVGYAGENGVEYVAAGLNATPSRHNSTKAIETVATNAVAAPAGDDTGRKQGRPPRGTPR
jgi:hypothetical protein